MFIYLLAAYLEDWNTISLLCHFMPKLTSVDDVMWLLGQRRVGSERFEVKRGIRNSCETN